MNSVSINLNMDGNKTRVLVVDHDEASFQVRKCIASVSSGLCSLELIYARDASEALMIIDRKTPDVILFNADESVEEFELLIESLDSKHPPIVLQGDFDQLQLPKTESIKRIPNDESIDAIHETLMLVGAMANNPSLPKEQYH